MKYLVAMTMLAMLVGCQPSVSGIPVVRCERGESLSPLELEAAKQAVEFWKLTTIGDSYYVFMIGPDDKNTIYEFRQIEFEVDTSGLPPQAKLNGLEFETDVDLYFKKVRILRPDGRWSDWSGRINEKEPNLWLTVSRVKGKWEVNDRVGKSGATYKKIETSDLPSPRDKP
jgi:hypothetical protein